MASQLILALIFSIILGFSDSALGQQFERPCEHTIFCDGLLLHTVQMAEIFNDSKTFVDRPLRYSVQLTQTNFDAFMEYHNNTPSKQNITQFVEYHFEAPGTEFMQWLPEDWIEEPKFLSTINDTNLRKFGQDLHNFWEELGRKIRPEIEENPDKYSLIYVPNGVIVPGGRFREFYYWDSYWIQEGLLKSEMADTVRGMIKNFVHMVNQLGFVPNGGRIYFQRSQPPLLIPMVSNYYKATGNLSFVEEILPELEKEFAFWQVNRSVEVLGRDGVNYTMFRYNSVKNGPRPESYKEDYWLADGMADEEDKIELYSALHSGAESGIDFSSRWFVYNRMLRASDLVRTSTRNFIPADLNGYIHYNAKILAEFHTLLNNTEIAGYYDSIAANLKTAINTILWDDELGCWFDYNYINGALHKEFFPTNIVPLWAGAQVDNNVVIRVMNYLQQNTTALNYPGGIPSSLLDSGEQWDFPNAWAPLEDMVIEALDRSGNEQAQELAFQLAQTWISTNYLAFYNSDPNHMYEKYNVTKLGLPGGGGEYEIVTGFGWTNGVVIDFLSKYGARLVAPEMDDGGGGDNDSGQQDLQASAYQLILALFITKLLYSTIIA